VLAVKCHYCGEAEATTDDHVIPIAMGGPSHRWNMAPACLACNQKKAAKSYEEFTGKRTLPMACVKMGFMTTEQFRLFRRQLSLWEAYTGERQELAIKKLKDPKYRPSKRPWEPGDPIEYHPAWAGRVSPDVWRPS
jgi:hypothetical protein